MAVPQLSSEQIASWTRQQKDAWWLANVFRGDMPQLTLRAAATGFFLGGILSATNLYIGARTGWTLGLGLTSVIVAFAAFRLLARLGVRDMTILENNAAQSVATAAGYMTTPLIGGLAAYMWVENTVMPWWQMMLFNLTLSVLGVLVAFPFKRRFINDEQQPFPEGAACGVVLDTLYTGSGERGLYHAKLLAKMAAVAATFGLLSGEKLMALVQRKWLGLKTVFALPQDLDAIYYWFVKKGWAPMPTLAGVPLPSYGLNLAVDFAMIGAGGLIGLRVTASMFLGMVVNFVVMAPILIATGEIAPKPDGSFSRTHIVNSWSLWPGIVLMVVASIVSLAARPDLFARAFKRVGQRGAATEDVVGHIELPNRVAWVGIPVVGAIGAWMANAWFGVSWAWGLSSIPLIIMLSLIAASSTALTGITPAGALSKIPQFLYGALDPMHPPTNLMTGVMCTEVAGNASNLLMDIKPGYMLGAKPRQQAVGHCIGIVAGALASTPLFFALFLSHYRAGDNVEATMIPEGSVATFPSALQWKGVADLVSAIFTHDSGHLLTRSIVIAMVVAAVVGIALEGFKIRSHGAFALSPLAIGLGVVLPPSSTMAMFVGALGFQWMTRKYGDRSGSPGYERWIGGREVICAGLIAGAALTGIIDTLVGVFWV